MSCDIVGSTQFKQKRPRSWQATFLAFYRQFPQVLAKLAHHNPRLKFELWKPVGDELIFTCRVAHEKDIYDAVRIWIQAMDEYEQGTLAKENLFTKGGAFLATFPGPDSESTIPILPETEQSDEDPVELNRLALTGKKKISLYVYDYFGPSIDTGFRILGACSQRHFTLTIEVAWAMGLCLQGAGGAPAGKHLTDIRLLTTQTFKGVWDGREYPVFALDRHSGDKVNDTLHRLTGNVLQPPDVTSLCMACFESEGWPSAMYLPESGHDIFKVVPVDQLHATERIHKDGREALAVGAGGSAALEPEPPL